MQSLAQEFAQNGNQLKLRCGNLTTPIFGRGINTNENRKK